MEILASSTGKKNFHVTIVNKKRIFSIQKWKIVLRNSIDTTDTVSIPYLEVSIFGTVTGIVTKNTIKNK